MVAPGRFQRVSRSELTKMKDRYADSNALSWRSIHSGQETRKRMSDVRCWSKYFFLVICLGVPATATLLLVSADLEINEAVDIEVGDESERARQSATSESMGRFLRAFWNDFKQRFQFKASHHRPLTRIVIPSIYSGSQSEIRLCAGLLSTRFPRRLRH